MANPISLFPYRYIVQMKPYMYTIPKQFLLCLFYGDEMNMYLDASFFLSPWRNHGRRLTCLGRESNLVLPTYGVGKDWTEKINILFPMNARNYIILFYTITRQNIFCFLYLFSITRETTLVPQFIYLFCRCNYW